MAATRGDLLGRVGAESVTSRRRLGDDRDGRRGPGDGVGAHQPGEGGGRAERRNATRRAPRSSRRGQPPRRSRGGDRRGSPAVAPGDAAGDGVGRVGETVLVERSRDQHTRQHRHRRRHGRRDELHHSGGDPADGTPIRAPAIGNHGTYSARRDRPAGADRHPRQELQRPDQADHQGAVAYPNHSEKVGTSVIPAQAMAINGTAAIAPLPSPRRMLRSSKRLLAETLEQQPMARFGRAVADDAVVEGRRLGERQGQHGGGDHIAVEDDGDRAVSGLEAAAAIATSSAPPTSRSTSSRIGDAGDAADSGLHRLAACGPDPRRRRPCRAPPSQWPRHPPARQRRPQPPWCCRSPSHRARAGWCRGRPQRRRPSDDGSKRSAVTAPARSGCRRWDRRSRRRCACTVAPTCRAKALSVDLPCWYAVYIALRHVGGVGADRRRRGDSVVGGEDQRRGTVDGRRRGALPRRPPTRPWCRGGRGRRPDAGCSRRARAPRRGRRGRVQADRRAGRRGRSSAALSIARHTLEVVGSGRISTSRPATSRRVGPPSPRTPG